MKHLFDKQNKYSIRKFSVGVCSAVIGLAFLSAGTAFAETDLSQVPPADGSSVRTMLPESEQESSELTTGNSPEIALRAAGEEGSLEGQQLQAIPFPDGAVAVKAITASSGADVHHLSDQSDATVWQSAPTDSNAEQYIQAELEEDAWITSVTYRPEKTTSPIPMYLNRAKLAYSVDGEQWETLRPVGKTGDSREQIGNTRNEIELGANKSDKTIYVEPVYARFVRLIGTDSWVSPRRPTGQPGIPGKNFSASGFSVTATRLTDLSPYDAMLLNPELTKASSEGADKPAGQATDGVADEQENYWLSQPASASFENNVALRPTLTVGLDEDAYVNHLVYTPRLSAGAADGNLKEGYIEYRRSDEPDTTWHRVTDEAGANKVFLLPPATTAQLLTFKPVIGQYFRLVPTKTYGQASAANKQFAASEVSLVARRIDKETRTIPAPQATETPSTNYYEGARVADPANQGREGSAYTGRVFLTENGERAASALEGVTVPAVDIASAEAATVFRGTYRPTLNRITATKGAVIEESIVRAAVSGLLPESTITAVGNRDVTAETGDKTIPVTISHAGQTVSFDVPVTVEEPMNPGQPQTQPPRYARVEATKLSVPEDSQLTKDQIAAKILFPEGMRGTVVSTSDLTGLTADPGEKSVTATVTYTTVKAPATVEVTSTNTSWTANGNNKDKVLTEDPKTFWASEWNASRNTPENREYLTLDFGGEVEVAKVRYQSQWSVNQHGQISKGYMEYKGADGQWHKLDLTGVTGGTGITFDDGHFLVANPSAAANLKPVTFDVTPVRAQAIRLAGVTTNGGPNNSGSHMVSASTFYALVNHTETVTVPVEVVEVQTQPDVLSETPVVVRTTPIPITTRYLAETDPEKYTDEETEVSPGKAGLETTYQKYETRNGVRTDKKIGEEYTEITTQMEQRVAKRGNKLIMGRQEYLERTEVIAITTRYENDDTKFTDEPEVEVSAGRAGEKKIYQTYETNKGVKTAAKVGAEREEITVQMEQRVVKRGTKSRPTTPTVTPGAYPPAETDPNYAKPAAGLGAITNFTFENGRGLITFETGEKAQLNFYNDHVFRYHVDKEGNFPDHPALVHAGRPATIALKDQAAYQNTYGQVGKLVDEESRYILETEKVLVIFDKASSRMSVFDRVKNEYVTKEVEPVQITANKTTQTLSQDADEQFFGGGMQNGRFTHKGNKINIVNENNWVDKGVASPAPFYWSSNGYGVLRNTFMPGAYNFGTENKEVVTSDHNEARFDAFYFVNDKPADLLKDYYELTGSPAVLPVYALYLGHLNAYNRDFWREVPEGTPGAVLQGNGKWYKEFDGRTHTPAAGDIKETLNGEGDSHEFSARRVIERYKAADMPLSWFLPNDGYGAGFGQGASLDENIENLRKFVAWANERNIEVGLWTQSNLVSSEGAPVLHRDIAKEVGIAGTRIIKTDVAWVGPGYNFGLNGVDEGAKRLTEHSGEDKARPFIVSLDGWAGTQRSAAIWSGDQVGGEWEYIRFHIPTYIGMGLSGNPNMGSDMDGIFGGANPIINARDYQWKTFSSILMNMDGWGSKPKMPFAFDTPGNPSPTTDVNRLSLKTKSTLVPYAYSVGHAAAQDGKPIVRAMFLEFPNEKINYTKDVQYQYMYGDNFLVAPVYKATNLQANGDDVRNDIYLPDANTEWIDFYTGQKYQGGQMLNNFAAPLWKLPVFVRNGAIIPLANPNNNPSEIDHTNRLIAFYPHGETSFKLVEDDGKSIDYKAGKVASTLIESQAADSNQDGRAVLSIHRTEGDYDGMVKEKTTELHVNVSKDVTSVEATVNGQAVTLRRAATLDEYKAGTNVFFYHNDPVMDTYGAKSDQLKDLRVVQNDLVKIKLAKADVTATETVVTLNGFSNKKAEADVPAGLTAPAKPTNLRAPESDVSPTAIKLVWEPVATATSYDIERDGVVYTNITAPERVFDGFDYGSAHSFRVRAVNAKGASDWTDLLEQATSEDPWMNAIENVRATTNITAQGGQGLDKLFNRQLGDTFHSKWGEAVAFPAHITVDLGGVYEVDYLEYHPRADAGNGTVTKVFFETSEDGKEWARDTHYTNWKRDGQVKTYQFTAPTARYVRMNIAEGTGNFVSGQELLIFKKNGTKMKVPGDTNNDGRITEDDKTFFLNYSGLRTVDRDFGYIQHVDMNKNGLVDAEDISVIATQLSGGVTTPSRVAPSGSLRFEAEKLTAKAGETLKVYLVADELEAVNALTSTFQVNAADFEVVNNRVVPEAFAKQAENFSQVRDRDGQLDAVFSFINFGQKDLLRGSGRVAHLTLKAKRDVTLDFSSNEGQLVGNDLRTSRVANQPVAALVNYGGIPTVPAQLTLNRPTHGSLTLNWAASDHATRYVVEQAGSDGQFVEVGRPTGTSFNVYNLAPETSYDFRVRATNPLGESANTATITGRTLAKDVTNKLIPVAKEATTPEQPGEGLDRFFDGDESTIYHSQWGKTDAVPSSLVLDLGSTKALDRLVYVPRPAASNGTITGLTVETSTDGTTWTSTGETIRWTRNNLDKIALFPLGTQARHIRINWQSGVGGFVSGQELYVIAATETVPQPQATTPRVFSTPTAASGPQVTVQVPAGETRDIARLRVDHLETGSPQTPAILKGRDYDLYDIELVDSQGRDIDLDDRYPARVTLQVDEGKTVEGVFYLPEAGLPQELVFETSSENGRAVIHFTAQHFSHYGILYRTLPTVAITTDSVDDVTVLEFSEKEIADNSLPFGERRVLVQGVPGRLVKTYQRTLVDGQETARKLVGVTAFDLPKTQLIRVGTRLAEPVKSLDTVDEILSAKEELIPVSHLAAGVQVTLREGVDGRVTHVYEVVADATGKELSRTHLFDKNYVKSISKLVLVGTGSSVIKPVVTENKVRPETTVLPFESERIPDASLDFGLEVVVREGEAGYLTKTYEDTFTNGEKTSERVLEVNFKAPVNKLIRVGTRPLARTETLTREVVEYLDFKVEAVEVPTLASGEEIVEREGVPGRLTKVYEDTLTQGVKTAERLVEIKDVVAPINKLVLVGAPVAEPAREADPAQPEVPGTSLDPSRPIASPGLLTPASSSAKKQASAAHLSSQDNHGIDSAPVALSAVGLLSTLGMVGLRKKD